MLRSLAGAVLILAAFFSFAAAAAPVAKPEKPLGIGLEGIDYPYPVHFLDLTI